MLMEIYESESEFAARKVRELKQQIIDTGNENMTVFFAVTCA
jgi:hypothetical protein